MQAAYRVWDGLLQLFDTTPFAFPFHPWTHNTPHFAEGQHFLQLLQHRYFDQHNILRDVLSTEQLGMTFGLLEDGTIPILRHFENFLIWAGNVASNSRSQFLGATENVLRTCCLCSYDLNGSLESRLKHNYSEDYSIDYITRRFNEVEKQFPSSASDLEAKATATIQPTSQHDSSPVETTNRAVSVSPSPIHLDQPVGTAHPDIGAGDQKITYICGVDDCPRVFFRTDNIHKHRRIAHKLDGRLPVYRRRSRSVEEAS